MKKNIKIKLCNTSGKAKGQGYIVGQIRKGVKKKNCCGAFSTIYFHKVEFAFPFATSSGVKLLAFRDSCEVQTHNPRVTLQFSDGLLLSLIEKYFQSIQWPTSFIYQLYCDIPSQLFSYLAKHISKLHSIKLSKVEIRQRKQSNSSQLYCISGYMMWGWRVEQSVVKTSSQLHQPLYHFAD